MNYGVTDAYKDSAFSEKIMMVVFGLLLIAVLVIGIGGMVSIISNRRTAIEQCEMTKVLEIEPIGVGGWGSPDVIYLYRLEDDSTVESYESVIVGAKVCIHNGKVIRDHDGNVIKRN